MLILRVSSIRQAGRKMLTVVARISLDTDDELSNISHAGDASALFSGFS
jgi:hypothetical protein